VVTSSYEARLGFPNQASGGRWGTPS
jgi:hypothetical protein